jgi:formate dehydrogenase major subunit
MRAAATWTLIRFRTILTKTNINSSGRAPRCCAADAHRVDSGVDREECNQGRGLFMDMNRRQFFRVSAAGLAGSSLAVLGFSPTEVLAETRHFKLARTTETRNTCPYCAVSCGVIMYGLGDKAKNVTTSIIHIEGDPDHPVNRGTLCPKGAGLLDFVHSPNRLKYPEVREAGTGEWKRTSWDDALSRIAKLMKADRDANFITHNADGKTVNRWLTTGMLCASASSNETAYVTHKTMRSMGMLVFDNQARV